MMASSVPVVRSAAFPTMVEAPVAAPMRGSGARRFSAEPMVGDEVAGASTTVGLEGQVMAPAAARLDRLASFESAAGEIGIPIVQPGPAEHHKESLAAGRRQSDRSPVAHAGSLPGKAPLSATQIMEAGRKSRAQDARLSLQSLSDGQERDDAPLAHVVVRGGHGPDVPGTSQGMIPLLTAAAAVVGPRSSVDGPERHGPQPMITVTIGRIEVRATVSPAQRAPKLQSRNPTMSLEEYLRHRSG